MFRPIYEPRTRAREYSDLAINIYKGCNHGCIYCYARKKAQRYTRKDCICSFNDPKLRPDIVEATKKQLAGGKYKGKKIMLCFMCDPYPAGIDTIPTREIIKAIKNAGANVSVLTKGGMRAARDFDLYDEGDSFGCTLTLMPYNQYQEYWEPKAATPESRFEVLQIAHDMGIKTWASLEPVIYAEDTLEIIKCTGDYIDLYKIGTMNYHEQKKYTNWKSFGEKAEELLKYNCLNYYIKEDLRKEMER